MTMTSLHITSSPAVCSFRMNFGIRIVNGCYEVRPGMPCARRGSEGAWRLGRENVLRTCLFRENLDGKLSLAMLADECGLSVSYFARSFRRTFATSAHRYLIFQRIKKAKELLTTSHLPLSEVGLESGFSDQAAFSRTFKTVVGVSPGKWHREVTHR